MKKALIIVLAVLTLFTAISCKNEPKPQEIETDFYSYADYTKDVYEYTHLQNVTQNLLYALDKAEMLKTNTDLNASNTDIFVHAIIEAITVGSSEQLSIHDMLLLCSFVGFTYPEDATETDLNDAFVFVFTDTDLSGSGSIVYSKDRMGKDTYDFDVDVNFKLTYTDKEDKSTITDEMSLEVSGKLTTLNTRSYGVDFIVWEDPVINGTEYKDFYYDDDNGVYKYGDVFISRKDLNI